jgi:hypothetical protein
MTSKGGKFAFLEGKREPVCRCPPEQCPMLRCKNSIALYLPSIRKATINKQSRQKGRRTLVSPGAGQLDVYKFRAQHFSASFVVTILPRDWLAFRAHEPRFCGRSFSFYMCQESCSKPFPPLFNQEFTLLHTWIMQVPILRHDKLPAFYYELVRGTA